MGRSLENLGLAPDLSRLPSEVRDLIRRENRGEYPSRSEAAVAVCTEMFGAGYGVDEIWVVMSDPVNGISEGFFEEDGERAEAHLEWIVSEAHEAANRREGRDV